MTLANREMWTVLDRSMLVSIVSRFTLCIGVPAFHYVMGGGWELCTQSVIVKRIRDNRHRGEPTSDLTLPYLKLV